MGLDLVAAARRQQRFMATMLEQRGELETKPAIAAAVKEYRKFLELVLVLMTYF